MDNKKSYQKTVFLLALVIICAAFIYYYCVNMLWFNQNQFNQQEWLREAQFLEYGSQREPDLKCTRGKMIGDLKKRYLTKGVTSLIEVQQLLGAGQQATKLEDCLEYPLGICSGSQNLQDLLYICFDKNNKIRDVHTRQ